MRAASLFTFIIGTAAALCAGDPPRPLAPTAITWAKPHALLGEVADALAKASGVPVAVPPNMLKAACDVRFDRAPFWHALQQTADRANARIVLTDGGRKASLIARGKSREVAATSGAFRIVAQQVVGRALLDEGITFHEVHLFVHWEPRLRVYRIDTMPKITKATDERGSAITAAEGGAQLLPLDATSEMKVKLTGVGGDRLTALAGEFTVTASDQLLAFAFDAPGGKLPAAQTQAGVSAALTRVEKKGDTWEISLDVTYPERQPVFESFQGEWWLRDNRLTVRSPAGKAFVIDDYEIPQPDSPRPLHVVHRFKENAAAGLGDPTAKGWSIVYETPAPLVEVKVPFALSNIPLP